MTPRPGRLVRLNRSSGVDEFKVDMTRVEAVVARHLLHILGLCEFDIHTLTSQHTLSLSAKGRGIH